MNSSWNKVCSASTVSELREAVVEELRLRAWQERAAAGIGRTNKEKTARAEHAAQALENLSGSY